MSELATLARPYAAAVFKRAKQVGTTEKWSLSLAFISNVLNDKNVSALIGNPKVNKQDLLTFMLDVCQGQVNEEGENFLKLLVHNGRLSLVSTISKIFDTYRAEDEGYINVEVTTAYGFSEEEQLRFTGTLEKKLSKKVYMNVTVDKSLIGGVLVRAGDQVIDGSIRGQLQHMQKALQ
jgi:F-type H+-transporting ATPase subunit delta